MRFAVYGFKVLFPCRLQRSGMETSSSIEFLIPRLIQQPITTGIIMFSWLHRTHSFTFHQNKISRLLRRSKYESCLLKLGSKKMNTFSQPSPFTLSRQRIARLQTLDPKPHTIHRPKPPNREPLSREPLCVNQCSVLRLPKVFGLFHRS